VINNIGAIPEIHKFKCRKKLANYLMRDGHFPLLGQDGKWFYFTKNVELEKVLENLPIWLKILAKF
jgi:hypothetical protein